MSNVRYSTEQSVRLNAEAKVILNT